MIGIIDYGMGNLRSVQKALEAVGARADVLAGPEALDTAERLVLPGVGAFADGMDHLGRRGWIDAIRQFIGTGRPFLGICLGMQLLFECSEEDAPSASEPVPGLGVLPGQVVRFASGLEEAGKRLKVPHMGWNTLAWERDDPLLRGLPQAAAVYFVHGYHARPVDSANEPITSATTDYGGPIAATAWRDNVWATQFHPEKSQRVGLKMLENFVKL